MKKPTKYLGGFSLVEVTLAIGIIAFAFVAVFGLIPMGLDISRQSRVTTISNNIAQRLITEFEQMNYAEVVPPSQAVKNNTFFPPNYPRLYNEQGQWGGQPAIYWVNVRITPAAPVPKRGTSTADNPNVAIITLQVAFNPSMRELAYHPGGATDATKPLRNLWSGAYRGAETKTNAVQILTYSTYMAKRKVN